jgi:hypothetical protein
MVLRETQRIFRINDAAILKKALDPQIRGFDDL